MDEKLAFVVTGTSSKEILPNARGLKGGSAPVVQGVNRLHIIVPIEQQRRLTGCQQPIGIDTGMPTVGTR